MSAARDLDAVVQEQVADIVRTVRAAYADPARGPVIHDVRYAVDHDWTGAPAIHITVVLRDPVGRDLYDLQETQPINDRFWTLIRERGLERIPYVTFQLESEQAWLEEQAREENEEDGHGEDAE